MPFVKVAGKWVTSADGSVGDAVPQRLVIVDKQVDENGTFRKSLNASCHIVEFDSKAHTMAVVCERIRDAHRVLGAPFLSIAFANHGPGNSGANAWVMAKDIEVDATPDGTGVAITTLAPLMEVMMACVDKKPTAHIAFLACNLASSPFLPDLIPAMEALYGVDFMASTDVTGNAAQSADWVLETDSFNFGKVYCDETKLKKYRQTMLQDPSNGGWSGGGIGGPGDCSFGGW